MRATQTLRQTEAMKHREIISRRLLRGMAILVISSLLIVSYARLTDRPLEAKPADGPVARERMIQIYADTSGAAKVLDVDGTVIADLPVDKGGFIAGVWRALAFERNKSGIDPNAPVNLVQFQDGRVALKDPLSGWRAELVGFGPDNLAAFARLLDQ